jgi:cytochrome P450
VWKIIRNPTSQIKVSIEELYLLKIEGHEVHVDRKSAVNQSPRKRGVARPENAAKEAAKTALAKLWHEALDVDDVSALCVDANELKRLMVSYSATIASVKEEQLFP